MRDSGKRLSAGVVVVRETPKGIRYLLLRAFNHWDFPKGLVEKGETPMEAAIREVVEETTLTDLDFVWGKSYIETGPYSRGKTARYYLARTESETVDLPPNPLTGRSEHVEYRWMEFRNARRLASPRLKPVVDWAAGVVKSSGKPS
ncbi:MAG: bis(5'-nucleosyl)-tetraphosphatase [Gammaproteobacteria bacterium]